MANNHFSTVMYTKLSVNDPLNGGWQTDGNSYGPMGKRFSLASSLTNFFPISPGQVISVSLNGVSSNVTINSVVEIIQSGLRVNAERYGSVDTVETLNTAAT